MIAVLLAMAITGSGPSFVPEAKCDLVELNHFHCMDNGRVITQLIFWDWSDDHKQFIVREWRMVKKDTMIPVRRSNPSRYVMLWHDENRLVRVIASNMIETHTGYDPERLNLMICDERHRKKLFSDNDVERFRIDPMAGER